tara:strand:+ start:625 stop:795 length:171 start_codon:yes stop_codon:yes gene_type:complete
MEIGLGMLHIPPDIFWNMSMTELNTSIDGFLEFSGNAKKQGMSKDELDNLMELYPD